jgi:hypothetical protein
MPKLRTVAIILALTNSSAVVQSQPSDVLNQFQGLWTAKWTLNGKSEIEQVFFINDPSDPEKRIASLPFLPGQAKIFHCSGLGCNGADLIVSGTGFDCLYAHSPYNQDQFAWTFKGGRNTANCPPDAEFTRVRPVSENEAQDSVTPIRQVDQTLSGLNIYYYTKEIDGDTVSRALNDAKIQFMPARSIKAQDMPTVSVAYGREVALSAIKKIAVVLIRAGVPLKVINFFPNIRPKSVLITAYVLDDGSIQSAPLSEMQVMNLSTRPRVFFNKYISNIDSQRYHILADAPDVAGAELCRRESPDGAIVKLISFNVTEYSGQVNVLGTPNDYKSTCQECNVFSDVRCQFSSSQ